MLMFRVTLKWSHPTQMILYGPDSTSNILAYACGVLGNVLFIYGGEGVVIDISVIGPNDNLCIRVI